MQQLNGKVAMVSGGAIGIGHAIALSLAEAGADVAVTYWTHPADDVVAAITGHGRRALALNVDATDSNAVRRAVEGTVSQLGRLDVVVANAGGLLGRVPIETMSDEHWHAVLETNLSSAFYLVRACLRHISEGGRIVLVSSLAAHTGGGAGAGAYAAAKAGLLGLTRVLAKELAPRGIGVYAVAPGLILGTPFHETFTPPAAQEAAIARIPAGRPGWPIDVAALVLHLASDSASFLTGQVINITGGQELT